MFKWGDLQLKVKVGSYSGPFPALSVVETNLIPVGMELPASSLQTGGRLRKRATMTILLDKTDDYVSIYDAYLSSEVRSLELMDGIVLPTAMIFGIDPPSYKDPWIECGIQFIEV